MPRPFNNPSELGAEGRRALDALQRSVSNSALLVANNLSDLDDAATARTNLGLGTAATTAATAYATAAQGTTADAAAAKAANLSDLASAVTARSNLGLGAVALLASVAKADLSTAAGELGAAWTSYTPTDSNIVVGNGTRSAAYIQIGKTVIFRWHLAAGTTSTLNAVSNAVGLPVAAKAGIYQVASAYMRNAGVRHWVGVAYLSGSYGTLVNTESGANGLTASGSPSAAWFGNGDFLTVTGIYEAA